MPNQPPKYFGGSATNFGEIKALDAQDFRHLVEGTLMLARRLATTRQEFLSQDKKRRDNLKRTAFLISASMKQSPSGRHIEDAASARLIFLDIDDPQHTRPLFESPGSLSSMMEPFSFALYTTANHTKEEPRLRLVVDADISDIKLFRGAVETVAALAGIPKPSPESKNLVLPMYLPVVFSDEDPDFDHPLLHFRVDGRPMTDDDVDPTLENRGGSYNRKTGEGELVDALEFLSEPVDGMTMAKAEQILNALDPDMSYSEWLTVCFALKHQFGGTLDEEDALDAFDLWSAGGKKYAGRDDVLAKWRSARSSSHGDGRNPVTMRSVMRMATARGWREPVDEFLSERLDSTKEVEKQLRGIAAAGLPPLDEEAALLQLATAAKKGGSLFGLPFLRKQLRKEKQLVMALETAAKDEPPPAWARGFIHVAVDNSFHRHATGEVFSPDALDSQFSRFLLEKTGNEEDDPALGSRPQVRPRDYLLNVLQIPTAYGTTYDPRKSFDHVISQDGKTYLNVYLPTWPDPDESRASEAGSVILKHLRNLVSEPDYRETLLHWLAWQVQHPGEKIRWAVLLQGAQGCGKTLLLDVLATALGRANTKSIEANVLFSSQFNDWAIGAQVVGFEEIRVVGHNRHEVMNRLKPAITNSRVMVNRKFYDLAEYDNVTNYLLFTNHHDALAVADGDRRYFVLKSRMQTRRQVEQLGEGYFKNMYSQINGNPGGVRAWLEAVEIPEDFDANGHAPRTKYFDELVHAAATEDTATVLEAVESLDVLGLGEVQALDSTSLLASIEMEGRSMGGQRLSAILREEGFKSYGRKFRKGRKRTLWARPDFVEQNGEEAAWSLL